MKTNLTPKQLVLIIAAIIIGAVLALLILLSDSKPATDEMPVAVDGTTLPQDDHAHDTQPPEFPRGPHGGKLFTKNGYSVEVTIFEQNAPPHFRLYTYQDGEALDTAASIVSRRCRYWVSLFNDWTRHQPCSAPDLRLIPAAHWWM